MAEGPDLKSAQYRFESDGGDCVYSYSVDKLKNYLSIKLTDLNGKNSLDLVGDWFIVDATDQCYYHFIFDNVGQFCALKADNPDLQLAIRLPSDSSNLPDYVLWSLEKLKLDNTAIEFVLDDLERISIDSLFAISTRLIPFFHLIEDEPTDFILEPWYQRIVVPALREFLLKHIPRSVGGPKKIYATRKSKSAELELRKDYLQYLKDNGVSWGRGLGNYSDPLEVLNNLPEKYKNPMLSSMSLWAQELDVSTRYISSEDEAILEKLFVDAGYYALPYSNVAYEDQLSMIAGCESYATITGSSVLNSVVCNPSSNIFVINNNTNWPMPNHEFTPTLISDNVHVVFSMKDHPGKVSTIEEITTKLTEIGI